MCIESNREAIYQILKNGKIELKYESFNYQTIIFCIILFLNPLNILLKYMIIKFDLFTEIAIEVQKYLNTRIYEFNPPKTNENKQLRYLCFITNTYDDDKEKLR